MVKGLSPLQRFILIRALDPKPSLTYRGGYWSGHDDYYKCEWAPSSENQHPPQRNPMDITMRHILRSGFDTKFNRRGFPTNAARVAVFRAFGRLIARGLLERVRHESFSFSGASLTPTGLAIARTLADAVPSEPTEGKPIAEETETE